MTSVEVCASRSKGAVCADPWICKRPPVRTRGFQFVFEPRSTSWHVRKASGRLSYICRFRTLWKPGTFGKPSGNLRQTFGEPCGNRRKTFGKPSGNLLGTFGEPSGNLRETFWEASGNLWGTFGTNLVPIWYESGTNLVHM